MKVRSSTRATSLGSECAQYEPGRFAGSSSVNVPASTSCLHEELVLVVGPVEPVDVVRLAELDHLVDPGEQSGVLGGGLHERHVALLQERKMGADECNDASVPTRNLEFTRRIGR